VTAPILPASGTPLLADDEENPSLIWAEVHRLRAKLRGPTGYATWSDAALDERNKRIAAERDLQAAQRELAKSCVWSGDGDVWETSCGNAFVFNDGGPKENEAKYCMYCGGKIDEHSVG
jgi:hypothetical protein